eukprot:ANDGO_00606.mRNA.1 WD repeat-containing protein 48 homolog
MRGSAEPELSVVYPDPRVTEAPGHRLGIRCSVFDKEASVLFTGGKDGHVCAHMVSDVDHSFIDSVPSHMGWINDIVVDSISGRVICASSDASISIRPFRNNRFSSSISYLTGHTDYVKQFAVPSRSRTAVSSLVSCALDGQARVWDLRMMETTQVLKHTTSLYCVDVDRESRIIACGTSDNLVRIWDSRGADVAQFSLHKDVVRSCVVSGDGSRIYSASSDGTIRVWDLGMQRCMNTLVLHSHSVLGLAMDDAQSSLISVGRDGLAFLTDIRNHESILFSAPLTPLISVCRNDNNAFIVSEAGSVSHYEISSDFDAYREFAFKPGPSKQFSPLRGPSITGIRRSNSIASSDTIKKVAVPTPSFSIAPVHSIKKFRVCFDKRRVLCLWDDSQVTCHHLCTGKVDMLGTEDFKAACEKIDRPVFVPSWCSVDVQLGYLRLTMNRNSSYNSEVYAVDTEVQGQFLEDTRVNIGRAMIVSFFKSLQKVEDVPTEENAAVSKKHSPNLHFDLSPDVGAFVCSAAEPKSTLLFFRVSDVSNMDTAFLLPKLPNWIRLGLDTRHVVEVEPEKIAFHLEPASGTGLPAIQQTTSTKLSGNRLLRARKIAFYVQNKLRATHSDSPVDDPEASSNLKVSECEIQYDLLCDGEIIPMDTNLGTLKTFYKDRTLLGEVLLRYKKKQQS